MRRILARAAAAILAVLSAGGAGLYWYLTQSLPTTSGTITVPGIGGSIEIVRDVDAIPHISASTKADAFFGLGYVHAQDRLWQMEFQRRIGHARLSEIFGRATIPQDRFLRTLGVGRAAQSAWDHLPADIKQQVDAYVAGINAFIDSHRGRRLPPEFTLLRFEPEPFAGPDVLAWVKMMAWDLSANYSLELMRHDIEARVGPDRMAQLLPPYPADGLSIVRDSLLPRPSRPTVAAVDGSASALPGLSAAFTASLLQGHPVVRDFLLAGQTEALGSNNWVVDGTRTASGKPMLANDPHLSTKMPSLWYLAHLSAGDFEVIGATLPGAPAMAIGRNRHIAWGETNVAADVQDFYRERLDSTGTRAEFRGDQEPIRIVDETIRVKGDEPVTVRVRITRHGPLISDAINANNAVSTSVRTLEPLAFRWTALDPEDLTIVAFMRLNEARNWSEFTEALRDYNVPSQNFVYADVDGHIGYYAPGHVPIRARGDGSRPVAGWTGEAEWTGWIPFEELPHAFDPPEHFIVTANNRPVAPPYPHFIALEYPEPYRAQRITDLLGGRTGLRPEDFRDIQADTLSLHAKTLVPLLLPHVQGGDANIHRALGLLRTWDFNGGGDSAAEAIFQAWFYHLAPAIVGDELGPVRRSYEGRFSYITRFIIGLLNGHATSWCDDVATPSQETCDQSVTKALEAAVADLTTRLGTDMRRWRWDRVHRAIFPHQGLDSVAPLRWFLSRSMPSAGDWSTVNVGPVLVDAPYTQTSIPGYRQIVDLAPGGDSRYLDAVGQSGHFLSPQYDAALGDWRAVRLRRMRMDRADFEDGAIGRLTLTPRP
jgi:penicillin amidase